MKANGAGKATAGAIFLMAALGLSGCASIDDALFGNSAGGEETQNSEPATAPEADNGAAPSDQQAQGAPSDQEAQAAPEPAPVETSGASEPEATAPAAAPPSNGFPPARNYAAAPAAPIAGTTIVPVSIEPGTNTGTAVSQTIAALRSDLQGTEGRLVSRAQQLADLRNSAMSSSTTYHTSKGEITARLQIGTTRGNPELVSQWNVAQSALDALTTNINALNALGTQVSDDSSHAHYLLGQVQATMNVSGQVDEDHRQLVVLEDETDQTIVLVDRLMRDVSDAVQRQTAYVANERANLTTLASAIKNGQLYGGDLGVPMLAGPPTPASGPTAMGGVPLVTIKFDRAGVDYQQILYTALSQALSSRPQATFDVVGVSPTRGTAAAVQLAQSDARRHAQDVMRSMTDMGVPAARMGLSSSTDPAVSTSEVRVFVR